jgi:hypothetical protein
MQAAIAAVLQAAFMEVALIVIGLCGTAAITATAATAAAKGF